MTHMTSLYAAKFQVKGKWDGTKFHPTELELYSWISVTCFIWSLVCACKRCIQLGSSDNYDSEQNSSSLPHHSYSRSYITCLEKSFNLFFHKTSKFCCFSLTLLPRPFELNTFHLCFYFRLSIPTIPYTQSTEIALVSFEQWFSAFPYCQTVSSISGLFFLFWSFKSTSRILNTRNLDSEHAAAIWIKIRSS